MAPNNRETLVNSQVTRIGVSLAESTITAHGALVC
jgi:hypothetical protein